MLATKLLWLETPTNPMMKIIDIAYYVALAKEHSIITLVDNTFASPYLQSPSTWVRILFLRITATKYLGGRGGVVMGALCTNNKEHYDALAFIANSCGAVPGPMDSFLVLRGLKTLHVRIDSHCKNGRAVAEFLKNHPKVEKVLARFPGSSKS